MNKISVLLLKSFFGPFVVTFMVSILLFELQFIWLYVDEMMGKGISIFIILQVLVYKSAELVSLALPLAILMSSIMTMGNLSENYELAALKSAGVGLFRILRPLVFLMIFISGIAFIFANNVWPISNLKFRTLMSSVIQANSSLTLEPGVFFTEIEGLSIRVSKIDKQTSEFQDIVIYDNKGKKAINRIIRAESGNFSRTKDQRYLLMTLENGYMYDEQIEDRPKKGETYKHSHITSKFEKQIIRYDLSSLQFVQNDEGDYSNSAKMMTVGQIEKVTDSLSAGVNKRYRSIDNYIEKSLLLRKNTYDGTEKGRNDQVQEQKSLRIHDKLKPKKEVDSLNKKIESTLAKKEESVVIPEYHVQDTIPINDLVYDEIVNGDFMAALNPVQKQRILKQARQVSDQQYGWNLNLESYRKNANSTIQKFKIEYHRKFYLGFSCIVLFFIGAPLGAILRKGGIGYPAIFALIFFMLFYTLNVIGERMAKAGTLEAWQGMWVSTLVLFPIGLFLTYKAATDSAIMDKEAYSKFFKKIFKKKKQIDQTTKNSSALQ